MPQWELCLDPAFRLNFFVRGRGSAGRASPCQGEGRGFESRRPLLCRVFELGHAQDVLEGRSALLLAGAAVMDVEAGEHGGVELTVGAVAGHTVGAAVA